VKLTLGLVLSGRQAVLYAAMSANKSLWVLPRCKQQDQKLQEVIPKDSYKQGYRACTTGKQESRDVGACVYCTMFVDTAVSRKRSASTPSQNAPL